MILLLLSRLMPAHPAARMLQFTNIHRFGWKKKRSQAMRCCFSGRRKAVYVFGPFTDMEISEPEGERAAKSPFWWRNVIFGVNHFLLWDPERC